MENKVPRNVAVDAYRGFVMLLMMAEVLHLQQIARAHPGNAIWSFLAYHQTHVDWAGCSLHDLIQPSFSMLVGIALPYSIASRMAKGQSFGRLFAHALWRSLLLIVLGIALRQRLTFEDTLTQIGLGYPFLFALGWYAKRERTLWITLALLLSGYWLAWVMYPEPDPWAKNRNLGAAFDRWLLGTENRGGYLTLNFIPTLGTMILGLIAGRWLREAVRLRKLVAYGAAGIALGLALHFAGIVPVVKRIWTPGWTIFSGGACYLLLAGFLWLVNRRGWRVQPLVIIGMNSIAAYMLAHLIDRPLMAAFQFLDTLWRGLAVLVCYYLILYWMYNRRLFLRI